MSGGSAAASEVGQAAERAVSVSLAVGAADGLCELRLRASCALPRPPGGPCRVRPDLAFSGTNLHRQHGGRQVERGLSVGHDLGSKSSSFRPRRSMHLSSKDDDIFSGRKLLICSTTWRPWECAARSPGRADMLSPARPTRPCHLIADNLPRGRIPARLISADKAPRRSCPSA